MDWFAAGGNGPLIVTRGIHLAATAIAAGIPLFLAVVAKPAFHEDQAAYSRFRKGTQRIAGVSLAIAIASGAVWLLFEAVSMSGLPPAEALTPSILSTVLRETRFGLVSEIRIVLAIILAICIGCGRSPRMDWPAAIVASGLMVSIAWTGHAGSTLGGMANLHLTADALHLVAAAAWTGGLAALILLLATVRRDAIAARISLVNRVVTRFSLLGIVSVGVLLVTGLVNSWILVGSFHAMIITQYGYYLMLKIGVFMLMLTLATVNRFWLAPRLTTPSRDGAMHQLTRNSWIEIVLGLAIFAIVGALGTLHPATHLM